jgi:hypothetical protein
VEERFALAVPPLPRQKKKEAAGPAQWRQPFLSASALNPAGSRSGFTARPRPKQPFEEATLFPQEKSTQAYRSPFGNVSLTI